MGDLVKVNEYQLFIQAGRLSNELKLNTKAVGLIDCAILSAAKINKLEIGSLDKKLIEISRALMIPNR